MMKTIKVKEYSEIPDNFTGIAEYANGTKEWRVEGKFHRLDGPAREWADGEKQWWIEGKLHRENGPAIERADGTKSWFKKGKLHREDGPAIEGANGTKEWWIEGKQLEARISIQDKIFLGKERGKYSLEWLKFLTEEGIEEYPTIIGLDYQLIQSFSVEEYISFLKRKNSK